MARKGECIWFDQLKHESAEAKYYTNLAERYSGLKVEGKVISPTGNPISTEIEKAMTLIGKSLKNTSITNATDLEKRVNDLEKENRRLASTVDDIMARLSVLEGRTTANNSKTIPDDGVENNPEDDDFDLFGSDNDEGTVDQIHKKKIEAKKPQLVAKSSLVLDVKPWDDETDMSDMETKVRSISADGLRWGAARILPVAYGIKKLQISCVIEDDKVGTDFLEESIIEFDTVAQSVDIVAFNKI